MSTIMESEVASDGHASLRERRIAKSALASAFAKIVSVSTALVSVPLTLHYLGAERYGMWMAMSSLVAFLSFADLGIGNGLLSSVASAHGRDDRAGIRTLVSSAYLVLSLIAVAVLAILAICYPLVTWYRIFNVQSELARAEAAPAVAVLIGCFALAIPVGVVQRTQMGLQKGYMMSLWQGAASVMGLFGVLLAIHLKAPLPFLVLAYVGAPLLAGVANNIVFFGFLERDIAPDRHCVSRAAIRILTGTGFLFLVLQLVAAATYMSDNFIIAHKLGASSVADYAVPERLFALIGLVVAMVVAPLWPAYGEAIARGDRVWVARTLKRSLLLSAGAAALGSTFLVIAAPWILELWVGHAVSPPFLLLLGLGLWKVVEAAGGALAMFLNGMRVIGFQLVAAIFTAVVAITLKFYFIDHVGIAGSVWATLISFTSFTLIPALVLRAKILRTGE
ncbi:oligosaccharide flippase family protein [Mesorhizobium sp. M0207]|uniref:lipopolysaccharide biosynthesis protein n=1 Tax=Mesorhizobium sp. M0207 TaxID=2956915 RepID=UPI003338EFB5